MTAPFGRSLPRRALGALLALAALAFLAIALLTGARKRDVLPPIVFVQRNDVPGSGLVPGVGPAGRTVVTGGRLVVLEPGGRLHPLVPDGQFFDVADPAVSYDGRWVAFAAVTARDSAWRVWICDAGGRDVRPLTRSDRPAVGGSAKFARYDDFDPCWLPDGRVVFASTRFPVL